MLILDIFSNVGFQSGLTCSHPVDLIYKHGLSGREAHIQAAPPGPREVSKVGWRPDSVRHLVSWWLLFADEMCHLTLWVVLPELS